MIIDCVNINQKYYSKPNTKNLSFESKRYIYKVKRPVLKGLESQAVYEKASNLLSKLPNSKMEKTVIKEVAGKKFGIRWDTRDSNNLKLKVKDNIQSSDTIEWNKNKDEQSVLECLFDSNGVMRSGRLTKKLKNNYSLSASYNRDFNNRKTVLIDGITYRPSVGTEEYWSSLPSLSCYSLKNDINLFDSLKKIELAELFCSLIEKNTTIK